MQTLHMKIKDHTRTANAAGVSPSIFARAAYRSGIAMTDPETGRRYEYRKPEILAQGVELAPHAPEAWRDRAALWAAVQSVETSANARLAREFELSIPPEISKEAALALVHDYCKSLTAEGMCADWAIHWKEKPGKPANHHVHILCTTRPIDEKGGWRTKATATLAHSPAGDRIPICVKINGDKKDPDYYAPAIIDADGHPQIPDGYRQATKKQTRRGKTREIPSWKYDMAEDNPFNAPGNFERWRRSWVDRVNAALQHAQAPERFEALSQRRQGLTDVRHTAAPSRTLLEMAGKGSEYAAAKIEQIADLMATVHAQAEQRQARGTKAFRAARIVRRTPGRPYRRIKDLPQQPPRMAEAYRQITALRGYDDEQFRNRYEARSAADQIRPFRPRKRDLRSVPLQALRPCSLAAAGHSRAGLQGRAGQARAEPPRVPLHVPEFIDVRGRGSSLGVRQVHAAVAVTISAPQRVPPLLHAPEFQISRAAAFAPPRPVSRVYARPKPLALAAFRIVRAVVAAVFRIFSHTQYTEEVSTISMAELLAAVRQYAPPKPQNRPAASNVTDHPLAASQTRKEPQSSDLACLSKGRSAAASRSAPAEAVSRPQPPATPFADAMRPPAPRAFRYFLVRRDDVFIGADELATTDAGRIVAVPAAYAEDWESVARNRDSARSPRDFLDLGAYQKSNPIVAMFNAEKKALNKAKDALEAARPGFEAGANAEAQKTYEDNRKAIAEAEAKAAARPLPELDPGEWYIDLRYSNAVSPAARAMLEARHEGSQVRLTPQLARVLLVTDPGCFVSNGSALDRRLSDITEGAAAKAARRDDYERRSRAIERQLEEDEARKAAARRGGHGRI